MADVALIKSRRFGDDRGWFSETYNARSFKSAGIDVAFVQDNHSLSGPAGTLRGLHFQRAPHAQGKLVRCVRGRIFDVVVDLRAGSPTFGKSLSVELTAAGGEQLWVPVGFAHGFATLEPDCEVIYKVTDFYAPDCEGGVRWDDPDIAIAWPLPDGGPALSPKDVVLPFLADIDPPFVFGPEDRPLGPLTALSV